MKTLQELREDCEIDMAVRCWHLEKAAEEKGEEFACKCEDPWTWTREQCLEYLKENTEGE